MVGPIEAMGSNETASASYGFYFSSQVMIDSIRWIMMKINPNLSIKAVENLHTKKFYQYSHPMIAYAFLMLHILQCPTPRR